MSDDKKYVREEEEYQFPADDEFVDQDSDEGGASEQVSEGVDATDGTTSKLDFFVAKAKEISGDLIERFPLLKNTKVIATVSFIFVVMVFLHFSHSSAPTQSVNTSSMQNKSAATVPSSQVSQVKDSVSSLASQEASTKMSVSNLKNQVSQLGSSVGSMQQSQHATNQSIRAVTDQLKKINSQLVEISKVQDTLLHPKDELAVAKPKPIAYHLKAVESGRAWIVGSNGESKSIIVGNTINDNYGTVTSINADQGLVYTSSKKIIAFGPNDR